MSPMMVTIVTSVISILFASLLTYFFTTRNMEHAMKRVVKNEISVHNDIQHQDNPWDVAEKKIKEHNENCGVEVKKSIDKMDDKVDKMTETQLRHDILVKSLVKNVDVLASKLDVFITSYENGHDDNG